MKNIIKIILFLIIISITSANAANYSIRELIPVNIETTIVTDNFSYKSLYYKDDYVIFKGIKNLSDNDLPISITIGLFDNNKKNIGTIHYCQEDEVLKSKEEKSYAIPVDNASLSNEKSTDDIHYIAVLDENIHCRKGGEDDFIGQKVEEIGMHKNTELDSKSQFLIQILVIIAVGLVTMFLYKFLFTNRFENIDGEDTRLGYKEYNKELKLKREKELREHPPEPKKIKKVKTDEVLEQEEIARNEDKDGTDLHNMYKK